MVNQRLGQGAGDPKKALPSFLIKRMQEGGIIFTLTLALYVVLTLSTYHPSDFIQQASQNIENAGGWVGALIAQTLYGAFGYLSYLLPFSFLYVTYLLLKNYRLSEAVNYWSMSLRVVGFAFLLIGCCGLFSFGVSATPAIAIYTAGGTVGKWFAIVLTRAFNLQGAILVLFALTLAGITWFTGLSWITVLECIGRYSLWVGKIVYSRIKTLVYWCIDYLHNRSFSVVPQATPSIFAEQPDESVQKNETQSLAVTKRTRQPVLTQAVVEKPLVVAPIVVEPALKPLSFKAAPIKAGLPSLTLLDKGEQGKPLGGYSHAELEELSRDVEQYLLDFGIQADVVAVHPGPVITRFELQLAAGIKVSKLSALAKDLARSLSVTSVRVVEIIPGKTVVGLELPNQDRAMVRLSEVLSADVYQQAHSPLTLALGVDIAGHPMVVDLAKMPHLLVAGTTGSGKSVGINAMILSLLFKATPEQVRLIMVDPKMLELSVYDGIPHLLTPVVTDMKEASSALRWCVAEMERRYRLMAALGVRNLAGFNAKIIEAQEKGQPLSDPLWKPTDSMDITAPELMTLPYIVVVIDELADMMMVVGKKVEQLIARIAQKARAAGIHLILATQRPSVDVLTGLIKSNIPTRISFQVSSKIDSRTILDQQGAEQLLGHGDMLFLAPGTGAPFRVHGAYVDDQEVHRIADDWRERGCPEYIEEITQIGDGADGANGEEGLNTEEADALYDQAVEFVMQTRKASISAVQRRFKIGYNRAARLVEEMERVGIVGPLEGGVRDVLVSSSVE